MIKRLKQTTLLLVALVSISQGNVSRPVNANNNRPTVAYTVKG